MFEVRPFCALQFVRKTNTTTISTKFPNCVPETDVQTSSLFRREASQQDVADNFLLPFCISSRKHFIQSKVALSNFTSLTSVRRHEIMRRVNSIKLCIGKVIKFVVSKFMLSYTRPTSTDNVPAAPDLFQHHNKSQSRR